LQRFRCLGVRELPAEKGPLLHGGLPPSIMLARLLLSSASSFYRSFPVLVDGTHMASRLPLAYPSSVF